MTQEDKIIRKVDIATETLTALITCDTKTEAAQKLGITRDALYKRIDQYKLQKYLDEIALDALEIIKKSTIKAAKNLDKKIDHTSPQVSLEASREILDRAGVTKPKEVNQTNVQVNNFGQVVDGLKKELNWNEEPEVS